jgi:hypothetical protein
MGKGDVGSDGGGETGHGEFRVGGMLNMDSGWQGGFRERE